MKKKGLFILLITVLLLVLTVGVASAITDGEPDGDGHPYVGLMVASGFHENASGVEVYGPMWRCSGTLLSPTLFLTAGHCTELPADHVEIWFDADVESGIPGNGYPFDGDVGGTPYVHPEFYDAPWFMHDLGVVVLDKPYTKMSEFGDLPDLNQLNTMDTNRHYKDNFFTAVGYGLQKSFPTAAAWKDQADRVRMVAYPHLVQINTPGFTGYFSLLLSNNTATGGTCFGDSGGPNFIGGSNVIAGVTSFGLNGTCGGTGGVYRVDGADDLNWLYGEFGDLINGSGHGNGKGKNK